MVLSNDHGPGIGIKPNAQGQSDTDAEEPAEEDGHVHSTFVLVRLVLCWLRRSHIPQNSNSFLLSTFLNTEHLLI